MVFVLRLLGVFVALFVYGCAQTSAAHKLYYSDIAIYAATPLPTVAIFGTFLRP